MPIPNEIESPRRDLPERTFEFARRIVKLTQTLDQAAPSSQILSGLLLKAGTAIGVNAEEAQAQAGQNRSEFVTKMSAACKEARETQYWLRLLAATELVSAPQISQLSDEATQLVAILTTIVRNTKSRE